MQHHPSLPRSHAIYTVTIIGFIATIHMVLPMYSNSSFLSLFASESTLGIIYMLGSAVSILGFLFAPFIIRKAGNYTATLWFIIVQIALFYGLTHTADSGLLTLFFILQTAVVALIGFSMDIFLESFSDSHNVGKIRGMYLTVLNAAWIIGPFIGTMIIGNSNNYRDVYVASMFMLFPLLYLVYKNFPKFKDPHYTHPSFWQTFSHVIKNRDYTRLFIVNSILNTFYAWMVVYTPIYLHTVVGFSWTEIGIIIPIMLLPFILVEWPLGKLADKKYGEKEIMTIGFALLGLSTIALATIFSTSVIVWALALFITRIGAASVEIMIETYFFKKVKRSESNMIGFFRITRPLSFFIAPFITGITLLFTQDQSILFVIIGVLCLLAMIPAWTLRDTN